MKAIKYFLLIPFVPLKFMHAYALESERVKIAKRAFLLGMLLYCVLIYMRTPPEYRFETVFMLTIVVQAAITKLISYAVLAFLIFMMSAIVQTKLEIKRLFIPLFAFSMLPTLLILPLYLIGPEWSFDLYWLAIIWEITIIVMGLYTWGDTTITKAAIIGIVCAVVMLILEGAYLRFYAYG